MVVQKTINNLKEGPKEDKVAVASGVAVSVVVVLLAGWAIYFFHNLSKDSQNINLSAGAQDQFNFTSVQEAQRQLQQGLNAPSQNDPSAGAQGNGQMQTQQMQIQGTEGSQFGAPPSQ